MIVLAVGCGSPPVALQEPPVRTETPTSAPAPEVGHTWPDGTEGDETDAESVVMAWVIEYHDFLIAGLTFSAGVLVGRRKKAA